jgi:signal transduction histidine kinase
MSFNYRQIIVVIVLAIIMPTSLFAQTSLCKDTAEHRRLSEAMWSATSGNEPSKVYQAAQTFQKHADEEGDLEAHYNAWMCGIAYNLDRMNIRDAYHIAVALKNDLKNITGGKDEQYLGPCMMAQVYNVCGNVSGAIEEFKESINLIKGTRYEETTVHSLYMGLAHLTLTSNPDQSLYWIEECVKGLNRFKDSPVYNKGMAAACAFKSLIYFKKGDYDNYRYWYDMATANGGDKPNGYTGVFMGYTDIYKKAVDGHVEEALAATDSVHSLKERYIMKSDLYMYAGETEKAYETQRELMLLSDSIAGAMLADNIGQMEQEMQMMKHQQEVARVTTIILTICVILAIIIIALLFRNLFIRWRYNQKLKETNVELEAANKLVTEADQQKTEFIHNLSHEIRTPLNIINGFAQILTDEDNSFEPEERQLIATTIEENTHQITSLVNNMVALSDYNAKDLLQDLSEVDSLSVCYNLIQTLKSDNNHVQIRLADKTPDGDTTLETNAEALEQMLNCLLENAVKFTEKGHILLEIRREQPMMQFTVEDTGCGISEEDAKHIFERYMKVNKFKEGLGLGLAYCHETAQKLGGTLTLDPAYKQGARFILKLPIKQLKS